MSKTLIVKELIKMLQGCDPNKKVVVSVKHRNCRTLQECKRLEDIVDPTIDFIVLHGDYDDY